MEKTTIKGTDMSQLFIMLLRITCFVLFAGRAYQYIIWDAPYRTLLWDQELMQGIIETFTSLTWEQYTTSVNTDKYIQTSIQATGWLYAVCAMLSLFIRRNMKWAGYFLLAGSLALGFLAFLNFKEKFFQYGEIMELGIQVTSPVLLFMALFTKIKQKTLILVAKVAVAFTFFGHGLYAWGYYPQPGHFIDMFINVLGFTEETSRFVLKIAAVLDFIAAVFIFMPRGARLSLWYCILWGGLTAVARIWSGFDSNFIVASLNQLGFEVMFRLSHALLPLWIFYAGGGKIELKKLVKRKKTNTTQVAPVTAVNYK